jgi:hypothetical protein
LEVWSTQQPTFWNNSAKFDFKWFSSFIEE